MCSRYELNRPSALVAARFNLADPFPVPNGTEIRPTDAALAIGSSGAAMLRWGLPVEWDARPLINARLETLASRPTFRRLLASRVLIPATGWWEWREDGRSRVKTRIAPTDGGLVAFAALADNGRFVIVTRAAAPDLAAVNDRMPQILPVEMEGAWVDPSVDFGDLAPSLDAVSGHFTMTEDPPPPSPQGSLF